MKNEIFTTLNKKNKSIIQCININYKLIDVYFRKYSFDGLVNVGIWRHRF